MDFQESLRNTNIQPVLPFGLVVLAGVPLLQPAWYCTQLTGKTGEAFFHKYPDAAYFEIAKSYYDRPEVGSWDWPEHYFSQRVGITNEAGLKLRRLGLAAREDFYAANSNRMIVTVYYNTREDILKKAREGGQTTVVLYAAGWGYTKLWRQIQGDFRDWRVLEKESTLDVYNLLDAATNRTVVIRAVSLNGGKRVRASTGAEFRFPQGQIIEWRVENVGLKPGRNSLTLSDAGPLNSALLLEDVRVE